MSVSTRKPTVSVSQTSAQPSQQQQSSLLFYKRQSIHCSILWRVGLVAFLVGCLAPPATASFEAEVAPGETECYLIRVPDDRPSVLSGNFEVLDEDVEEDDPQVSARLEKLDMVHGNAKPILLWSSIAQEPSVVTSSHDLREATFSTTVDPVGRYRFCLSVEPSNEDDAEDPFHVGFHVRLSPLPRSLPDAEAGPDAQRARSLVEAAQLVHEDWGNLQDHWDYLRSREAIHHTLANKIRHRVLGWSIAEAVLVVLTAVAQVIYLRRFFEKRRYL